MNYTKASDNWFAIIMAGGSGERFWPVSRRKNPKQLLKLLGGRSFLQQAVSRASKIINPSNIFVITNIEQEKAVRAQLPRLNKNNIIAEPCGRDTCAAVTLGAALVGARNKDAVMAVLPADHVVLDEDRFLGILSDSFSLASKKEVMITIGIEPTEPHTGFGYIKLQEKFESEPELKINTVFWKAERFVEKPPYEKAVEYLRSGGYRWNAGMFIWSYKTLLNGLQKHQPGFYELCLKWTEAAFKVSALTGVIKGDYPGINKISVDYALMERAENVVVASGDFRWDDLGSWSALYKHLTADEHGNCIVGNCTCVDSHGNLVFDARKKSRSMVATVGVKDSIVVLTDDAILIAQKGQDQKIKELVKKLAENSKYKKLL
ncbi:MAG: sugar phosphate nucleotidyltransferase [Verrucomicrobiae bacterium]|nr:sugar phosphate nucleotidyltransferase [Verrucomicrobiae bacterium]